MVSRFLVLLLLAPLTSFANWPQFRGPDGQGHVPEGHNLPLEWSQTKNVTWRADIPGRGWSSPIVVDGKIYLTTAVAPGDDQDAPIDVDRSLRALALDAATGEILWDTEVFGQDGSEEIRVHKKNSHASPTPIMAWDNLFVHYGHQGTACLKLDGKIRWKSDAIRYTPVHGNGGSPIVVGDKLIFSCDGGADPFVAALNVRTGRIAWTTKRDSGSRKSFSFCTPLLIKYEGREELILPGSSYIFAYNPSSGKELWRSGYGDGYSVVPRPVFGHGLIYASSGYDRPALYAVKPGGNGDVTESNIVWVYDSKGVPRNASFLLVGDELYTVDDKGIGTCFDAKTGAVHWQERVSSDTSASPIYSNGRIYTLDEAGTSQVLQAGKEFKILATNSLNERALASMAVHENALFIRTADHLYRIEDN